MEAVPTEQNDLRLPWRLRLLAGSRAAARGAVDMIWPPTCIHCRAAIQDAHGLCPACWRGLSLIERPYCERLGTPFAVDHGGPMLSPEAIANPPAFDHARAVALYDDTARALVTKLKFSDRADLALTMGRMMAAAGRDLLDQADAIVPVPLHRLRFWQRRYNQAALLAAAVAKASGVPHHDLWLARIRRTPPQVGLSKAQRAANLTGAFRVPQAHAAALAGRRIVLIDDVLTTGATVSAAARALRRAGAARIDVLTFAHAVKTA